MDRINNQIKRISNKIKDRTAFTLAEMLIAMLIMLMASSIVVAGLPAAMNAYKKIVMVSNAEILLSTTMSALRNELGTSQNIDVVSQQSGADENTTVTYFNASRGASSRIYVQNNNIMFQRYYFDDSYEMQAGVVPDVEQLVSQKAATKDLHVKYSSVTYSSGLVVFHDLAVYQGNKELLKRGEEGTFSIRTITY